MASLLSKNASAKMNHLKDNFQVASSAKILAAVIGVLLLIYIIYCVFMRFITNRDHYPVLLRQPIRGATFTSGDRHDTVYPVVDRKRSTTGIKLPFLENGLAFVPEEGVELPKMNHQVQFTLSFWMKPENLNQIYADETGETMYTQLLAQNTKQFIVLYDATQNVLAVQIRMHSGNVTFRFPDTLRMQAWQHVVLVLDNRYIDVYIDGVLVHSRVLSNVPELRLNKWHLFPGSIPFTGTVSCVRYFDYAFNRYEVQRVHRHTKPKNKSTAPTERAYLWWMWYKGNSFTALLNRPPAFQTPAEVAADKGDVIIPR
jgi:hypothetical protein